MSHRPRVFLRITHPACQGNLCTPLHVASELGHFDLLCLLLEGAADPACRDASGASPLHRAARRGTSDQKSAVGALLDAGALCDSQDAQGRTALHEAAREGHASAVRRLLEGRADSNVPDGQNHTPLHLAAQQGRLETVQERRSAGRGRGGERVGTPI
ncbi:unnamed protein product [Effrenium voratum]|nr:unnamed protein product [Effrenium voratum]